MHKLDIILNYLHDGKIIIVADTNAKSILFIQEKRRVGRGPDPKKMLVINKPGFPDTFRNRVGAAAKLKLTWKQ